MGLRYYNREKQKDKIFQELWETRLKEWKIDLKLMYKCRICQNVWFTNVVFVKTSDSYLNANVLLR